MTSVITPTSQAAHVNAFSNRVFEFDTISSKYYIARTVNENLLAHGTDCVLSGLDYTYSCDWSTNLFTINIEPGRAIVDTTLIELLETTTLDVNISPFDEDNGFLAVFLSYRFLETPLQNPVVLKLFYITYNGEYTIPVQFETDRDRLLIGMLLFNKTSQTVNPVSTSYRVPSDIVVHDKRYLLRPMSDLKRGTLDEMYERFKLVDI